MPTLARNYRNVTVLGILHFGNSEIDDLLLHCLSLFIARVEMLRKQARLVCVASIKELYDGTRRVHSSGSIDAWAKPEPEIVCCHALAVSATGNVDQRAQTGIGNPFQVLQSNRYDGAVFPREFGYIGDGPDCDNFHKCRHLRLAPVLSKQRVHQFESDADSGEVLVGILAAS